MSLFAGNVSHRASIEDIRAFFSKFGPCNVDVKRGYAFIDYEDERDAEDARSETNGKDFYGMKLNVEWSKKHLQRTARLSSSSDWDRRSSRLPEERRAREYDRDYSRQRLPLYERDNRDRERDIDRDWEDRYRERERERDRDRSLDGDFGRIPERYRNREVDRDRDRGREREGNHDRYYRDDRVQERGREVSSKLDRDHRVRDWPDRYKTHRDDHFDHRQRDSYGRESRYRRESHDDRDLYPDRNRFSDRGRNDEWERDRARNRDQSREFDDGDERDRDRDNDRDDSNNRRSDFENDPGSNDDRCHYNNTNRKERSQGSDEEQQLDRYRRRQSESLASDDDRGSDRYVGNEKSDNVEKEPARSLGGAPGEDDFEDSNENQVHARGRGNLIADSDHGSSRFDDTDGNDELPSIGGNGNSDSNAVGTDNNRHRRRGRDVEGDEDDMIDKIKHKKYKSSEPNDLGLLHHDPDIDNTSHEGDADHDGARSIVVSHSRSKGGRNYGDFGSSDNSGDGTDNSSSKRDVRDANRDCDVAVDRSMSEKDAGKQKMMDRRSKNAEAYESVEGRVAKEEEEDALATF